MTHAQQKKYFLDCPEKLVFWKSFADKNSVFVKRIGHSHYQKKRFWQKERSAYFSNILLKEVFQPHLPVRLPCYDFTPVTSPALGVPLQTVGVTTLGIASSHGVTGGVYKARERIHRSMADLRLLAIPTSCRRVAACNPN